MDIENYKNKSLLSERICVILPVYNEQENIESVVKETEKILKNITANYSIIAVNDGSTDETSHILADLLEIIPCLQVVTHSSNIGYGAALRSGISSCSSDWIILMDSDGQFSPTEIMPLCGAMVDTDCVLGVRINRSDPCIRRFLGSVGNWFACLILKRRILDINCGLKLFKTNDLKSTKLFSTGGIINTEILFKLFNKDFRARQITVYHKPRIYGNQTGGNVNVILKIWFEGIKLLLKKT